jgi:NTE family protein
MVLGLKPKLAKPKTISLALQGGGAHGAFEWGVIERLLEDDRLEIKAVTAASAGAMNAVALAAGLLNGGRAGAKAAMDAYWRGINQAGGQNIFGSDVFPTANLTPDWLKNTPAYRMAETMAMSLSPYEFNPLNLNPLHDLLEAQIDFKALRERSPVALYISATNVFSGQARIFRGPELTAQHVMASACLPNFYQAVEIEGEPYWDGGYTANPALWPLFYDPTPDDILILNLNPMERRSLPRTPGQILDRLNEITFNASLSAELRSIAFVQKLIADGQLKEGARGRYRNMLVHGILAQGRLDDLSLESKFNTEWGFLTDLKARGRAAADDWLATCFEAVGKRSSLDFKAAFL